MKKQVVKIWDLPSNGAAGALLILAAVFLIGGLAGCVLANRVDGSGEVILGEYLEGYLSAVGSGTLVQPGWFALFWRLIRWPLFVVVFGLTPLGLLGVPILFLIRAFLLSFSVASFFRILGVSGLLFGFVLFGISGLIAIPVLFVLGVQGLLCSGSIVGRLVGESRRSTGLDRAMILRSGICAACLCLCCVIEFHAVPVLLEALAGSFTG